MGPDSVIGQALNQRGRRMAFACSGAGCRALGLHWAVAGTGCALAEEVDGEVARLAVDGLSKNSSALPGKGWPAESQLQRQPAAAT